MTGNESPTIHMKEIFNEESKNAEVSQTPDVLSVNNNGKHLLYSFIYKSNYRGYRRIDEKKKLVYTRNNASI
jgi:hypothetical protein